MKKKIIIVGGGAAGITAAIVAARHDAEVTILEHKEKIGSKLLLTGNGKCNLTNLDMDSADYCSSEEHAADFIDAVLKQMPPEHITDFFHSLGLRATVLRDSYVYPETEAAASVVSVLLRELKRLSVQIHTECHVTKVYEQDQTVCIETVKETYHADEVILACGGFSYPKTGSDGSGFSLLRDLQLELIQPYPALTALVCSNKGQKTLSGLRQNARVRLFLDDKEIAEDFGQIQFTDYGISGIPVFCVSSYLMPALMHLDAAENGSGSQAGCRDYEKLMKKFKGRLFAKVDLFPDMKTEEVTEMLEKQSHIYGVFSFEDGMNGLLHKKWIQYLTHRFLFGGKTLGQLKQEERMHLADELKGIEFPVTDVKGYDFCQVTGGGLSFNELRKDFSLKKYPHIRVVGELLNLTGKCGGYNLHWAFASGILAGEAAAL